MLHLQVSAAARAPGLFGAVWSAVTMGTTGTQTAPALVGRGGEGGWEPVELPVWPSGARKA